MLTTEKFTMLATEFLRISKFRVVQVQIHPEFLDLPKKSTQSSKVSWFEKKHLREILDLIKPIVLARCNCGPEGKGGGGAKKSPATDRILSGSSVRIGYEFKRKDCNDTCLVDPRTIVNCFDDGKELLSYKHEYRFFHIYKEKILVYVCPIDETNSQNIMTQLHSMVGGGGKKQNTVGISSYFQKSPHNKTSSSSTSQSAVTSETTSESKTTSKTRSGSTTSSTAKSTTSTNIKSTTSSAAVKTSTDTELKSAAKISDKSETTTKKAPKFKTESMTTVKPVSKSNKMEEKSTKPLIMSPVKVVPKSTTNETDDKPATKSEPTTATVTDDGPRSKIKNIIEKSGPKLSRKKKIPKKSKDENLTLAETKQPHLTDLFSFKTTKNNLHSTKNQMDCDAKKITENEAKDLDVFSSSSSEDGNNFIYDFKPDIFDPGKTSTNINKRKNLKTYSNFRAKSKRKVDDSDIEFEPNIQEMILSLNVEEDDLTAFEFKKYSKTETTTKYNPKNNLQTRTESEKEAPKIDHHGDPFEFESDSKEELELEDKIQKLKSAVINKLDRESHSVADPVRNHTTKFSEINGNDAEENESQILEEKIKKLKSCIRENISSDDDILDDQKSTSYNRTNGCSRRFPRIQLTKCDNMRLDDRDGFRLDNQTDSDCPDSSTPVFSKTKPRINFPRLSDIFHCDNATSAPSVSNPNLKIPNFSCDSQSSDTEINPKLHSINSNIQRTLPQRKTPRIPILDQSELPELPPLTPTKEVKKRKRTDTKPKTKTKVRKISDFDFGSDSTQKTDTSILDFFSKLTPSKSLKASDIERDAIEVKEDFDIKLIEELSDMPKVKNEGNLELRREILKLDDVCDLSEAQIRLLVLNSETYLREIFQGKTTCERHQDYKRGGKHRNNLNYQVHLDLFTEEQTEVVMETLMGIFCKKHHKYLDYLLKVLLPEILIRIYMEVKGTTYDQTEEIMRN